MLHRAQIASGEPAVVSTHIDKRIPTYVENTFHVNQPEPSNTSEVHQSY